MPPPKRYVPRPPQLTTLTTSCLDPAFVRLARADRRELEGLVAMPTPGVLEFPLFTLDYALAMLREAHRFEHWCEHHGVRPVRPNSMNRYGVVLSELGLEDAMDELLVTWLAPMAHHFFPEHAGESLDHQHSFLVDYAEAGDTQLDLHVDDSEVTLNVCLGAEFTGAEVYFCGERCDLHRSEPANDNEAWAWAPSPGRAILHAGANRHGVRPLTAGRRVNLVLWARSSRHRRAAGAPNAGPAKWCPTCKAA